MIAIYLDGYEPSLEVEMRAQGELPNLAALVERGTRADLRHGPAQRTGLAGEHVSTGRSPDDVGRYAAVDFDPRTYVVRQVGTRMPTFLEALDLPSAVFDMPYFDLARTPRARGVVNWGAHDPGVPTGSRPVELHAELVQRWGAYPASEFIYRTPWASPELCREMGERLTAAVDVRAEAARWLLEERIEDWQLALLAVSEPHSVIEGLWHGIDPAHRLAGLESSAVAGAGVRSVYRAVDRLVGTLMRAFPEATFVVFSMHGMGTNTSDVASMALLPELLYRHATGSIRLRVPDAWRQAPGLAPPMESDASWSTVVLDLCGAPRIAPTRRARLVRRARRATVDRRARAMAASGLTWMPAVVYADAWSSMPAFALPSFYDGRVRVNLQGRERRGVVPLERYEEVLDEVEDLVRSCVDPASGASPVDYVERPAQERGASPTDLGPTDADLVIVWKGPLALQHPTLGLIGPLPHRRTGGHSGPFGSLVVAGTDVPSGEDLGVASAFDVVPTIVDLLGARAPDALSGNVLLRRRAAVPEQTGT